MSRALLSIAGGPSVVKIGSAGWTRNFQGNPTFRVKCPACSCRLKHNLQTFAPSFRRSSKVSILSLRKSSPNQKQVSDYKPFESQHRTMSWLSRGTSNAELIQQMQSFGALNSERVADVMRRVDRGLFVPPSEDPYQDAPQTIGFNATISAPHMHAHCLELLEGRLKPGAKALDVGSGTGYLTACMGLMIENEGGRAVGVEHIRELTEKSKENVRNSSAGPLLEQGVIELHTGDGRQGWPPHAPYDVIHVGAAAPETPNELINQLKPGGRLVCPVGSSREQYLMVYDKDEDGSVKKHASSGVRYIPLTSEREQRKPRGRF